MTTITHMAKFLVNPTMTSLLVTISTVLGCGVIPAGQASTRTFMVRGFTLPVGMVYSTAPSVRARFPGTAFSEEGAKAFVGSIVMQTVFDVLERQARSALLPDPAISAILGQLNVQISYNPLHCPLAVTPEQAHTAENEDKDNCVIVGNTVTVICKGKNGMKCSMPQQNGPTIKPVPSQHLTISGTLTTSNIIMTNWSRMMWQSVVNRAIRMLASGPFESHFISASATVNGN
ncbi:hypothetical protein KIN20_032967 [Parelaphostrongylus tenuis]|uniref:Uncharacterized protein n=1 Tax=Parelaphostrongylus tenuis TaxID=148309 RepID=A0AAD5WI21_PARTN|nr:hypothetical protein KIN20_032967 [Parelaphostrongylus tenuis]